MEGGGGRRARACVCVCVCGERAREEAEEGRDGRAGRGPIQTQTITKPSKAAGRGGAAPLGLSEGRGVKGSQSPARGVCPSVRPPVPGGAPELRVCERAGARRGWSRSPSPSPSLSGVTQPSPGGLGFGVRGGATRVSHGRSERRCRCGCLSGSGGVGPARDVRSAPRCEGKHGARILCPSQTSRRVDPGGGEAHCPRPRGKGKGGDAGDTCRGKVVRPSRTRFAS